MNRIPNIDREIAMMDDRFTVKLHRLLGAAEEQGFADVIQWDPGGRSFTIYKPELFAETIMKQYFKQTKYKSFQRQLNLYAFKRVARNGIRGVYHHPLFVRNDPFLCQQIKRKTQSIAPSSIQQTSTRRQQRDEVVIPPLHISSPHPFDKIASESIQATKASHNQKHEHSDLVDLFGNHTANDDESIETIDGYVDDIEAGELFKVGNKNKEPTSNSRIER